MGVKLPRRKSQFFGEFCLTSRIFLVSVLLFASVERCFVSRMQDFILCFSSSSLSYKFKIRTNLNTFQTSFLIFFIKLGIVLIFTSTFSIIPRLNKIIHSQEVVFQLLALASSHFNYYLIWFPRRVALTFGIQQMTQQS